VINNNSSCDALNIWRSTSDLARAGLASVHFSRSEELENALEVAFELWLHLTLLLRKLVRTFPQLVSGKSLASSTTQKWGLIEYKS